MELYKLTTLKTNSITQSNQLRDINGIIGVADNIGSSLDSLSALVVPDKIERKDIDLYDDDGGAYPDWNANKLTKPSDYGYLFDIKKDYVLKLQSDITDHWTEENFVINDHIANKPVIITLTGQVGELTLNRNTEMKFDETKSEASNLLNDIKEGNVSKALNRTTSMVEKAGAIANFAPGITNSILAIKNTIGGAYGLVNRFKSLSKRFGKKDKKGKPKINRNNTSVYFADEKKKIFQHQYKTVYDYFYTWWKNKVGFTVITPYGPFVNMFIQDMTATQGEKTKYVTDISITFKQINIAKTQEYKSTPSNRIDAQINKKEPPQKTPYLVSEQVGTSGAKINGIKGEPAPINELNGVFGQSNAVDQTYNVNSGGFVAGRASSETVGNNLQMLSGSNYSVIKSKATEMNVPYTER